MKYLKINLLGSILALIFITSCNLKTNNTKEIECKEGINLLPMYGRVEKCKGQLESDNRFLSESDRNEPNRIKACVQMLDNGWYYLHQGDYDTAMKRTNQAWLLDSTNLIVYASFAVILELKGETSDAVKMLDLTFNKLNSSKDTSLNDMYTEFIVKNIPFTYAKTQNPAIGEFVDKKLDSLNLNEEKRNNLKKIIETSRSKT